ncbi:MAG: hypothetical protein ABIU54_06605 [Candidatus Eisenbacteria bacterium]
MGGLAENRTAGSGGVAARFLSDLQHFIANDRSHDIAALRQGLYAWVRNAQAEAPSFALVHQFSARALSVANAAMERGDSAADLRAHLAQSCHAEATDLATAIEGVARTAAATISVNEPWIATLSNSTAVHEALRVLHREGRSPRVLLAESRPRLEGRDMAAALAADGIPVWLVTDVALPMLMQQATALWLGANAVTEHGVLSKIGSFVTALAAREHGVTVHGLAHRRKFLPATTRSLAIAEMPAAELWEAAPQGVRPRNIYFEMVPIKLVRGICTEDGVVGPSEAVLVAQDRALPDELESPPSVPLRA